MKKKYIFLALLVAVAGVEIFLRITRYQQLKVHAYPMIYAPDSLTKYRYVPNAAGYISKPSIEKKFVINSEGYTGPEFSPSKPDGKYRIIVAGNSNAGGIWLHGHESYPIVLQSLYKKTDPNVEVVACAIDGFNRNWEMIKLIKHKLVNYSPDLIVLESNFPLDFDNRTRECYKNYVLEYSLDSPETKQGCIRKVENLEAWWPLTLLYDLSYSVRLVCKYYIDETPEHSDGALLGYIRMYREKSVKSPMLYYRFTDARGIAEMDTLNQMLRARNTKLVMLSYREPILNAELKRIGVPSITLRLPETKALSHAHDGHFNPRAHRLIAERLHENLNAFITP